MEKIKLNEHESYYLLLLKNWHNPDIEYIKDESRQDRFRRSVAWIFRFDDGPIDKSHAFSIITTLALKCLSPWKMKLAFDNYDPYRWHCYEQTLEECFISELSMLKNDEVEYDYKHAGQLVSKIDGQTVEDWCYEIKGLVVQYTEGKNSKLTIAKNEARVKICKEHLPYKKRIMDFCKIIIDRNQEVDFTLRGFLIQNTAGRFKISLDRGKSYTEHCEVI